MLTLIDRPAMSHPYISVDSLEKIENLEDSLFLLKDIVRGLDSTNYVSLRRFINRYSIPPAFGNKQGVVMHIAKFVLRSARKTVLLEDMRDFLLLGPEPFEIIEMEERDYDGILGAVVNHKHFNDAYKWMLENYTKPKNKEIALFTTCASVKPYPISPSFSVVMSYLSKVSRNPNEIHWLVLSNVTAPVPQELHNTFPFYAYETDITKLNANEAQKYVKIAAKRLEKYLRLNNYDYYIALIRPSSIQRIVLEQVKKKLDLDIIYLPTKTTIKRINALGVGYWSRMGMKHKYTLNELALTINRLT